MSDNPQTMIKHYDDLTRDEILSMQGRELDIAVAVHLMNYEKMQTIYFNELDQTKKYYCIVGSPASEEVNAVEYRDGIWSQYLFNPSEDISAAMETLRKSKFRVKIEGHYHTGWEVTIDDCKVTAWELPEALSKCVLLAVMGL